MDPGELKPSQDIFVNFGSIVYTIELKVSDLIRRMGLMTSMSIVFLTKNANWQKIANTAIGISGECIAVPHYLWVERPENSIFAAELELLFRNLGLEEQWAYLETVDASYTESYRIVDASDASLAMASPVGLSRGPVT